MFRVTRWRISLETSDLIRDLRASSAYLLHGIVETVKLNAFLALVAHTAFSFIAALASGFALYSFFVPILGKARYHQLAKAPLTVLLLIGVALGGVQVYRRWPDRRAFFAWVFPSIWLCHLIVSRGIAAVEGSWSDPMFFLAIGCAYSVGAFICAIVTGRIIQKPPAELS
jgi:hypothetical protein